MVPDRGHGGYWSIIIAAVGVAAVSLALWVLLQPGEPYLARYERLEEKTDNYHAGGRGCSQLRLGRLTGRERADERERCAEAAEEHRLKANDLVQQTRSAVASEAVVRLTYEQSRIALAGLIIGIVTVVAAIAAALYARQAAIETKHSANAAYAAVQAATHANSISEQNVIETRRIGEAQVRCYLHIVSASISLEDDAYPTISICVKNFGQSPAINLVWRPAVNYHAIFLIDGVPHGTERNCDIIMPNLESWGKDIAAGESTGDMPAGFGFRANEYEMAAFASPDGLIFGIDINMAWKDVFGCEFRLSKGFRAHVKCGQFGQRYPLFQMGTDASLTQEQLRHRHEERERAKSQDGN